MSLRRILIDGGTYHVTSRTNAKNPAFLEHLGRKIVIHVLREAKEQYGFTLHNFCVMPNHIHLLITPKEGTNLSKIMRSIKINSAKIWNRTFNSIDHLWGQRFYSRIIKNAEDFSAVFDYINHNPIKAGLVDKAEEWEACGAYYLANDIEL